MEPLFPILRFSLHIAALIGLVLLLQWSLRPWLAPRWRCWLWGLVVLRLCLPVTFGTGWSLYNLLPSPIPDSIPAQTISQTPPAPPPARSQPIPSTDLLPAPNLLPETTVSDPIAITPIPTRSSPNPTASPDADLAPPTAEVPLPWIRIWAGIWLAGACTVLFGILRNARRMGRWVASGEPVTDPDLLHAVAEAGRRVGVRNIPQVIELPGLDSPALWGALHPTLLLPPGMAHRLDPTQFRHVLLHEFAHIRRHDIALNWLLAILQATYWFHPFVWLAFNRLRSEREIACDDIALHAAGADESEAYGRTLLHLLSHLARPATSPGMVGILEGNGDLRRRLSHIAGFRPGRRFGFLAAMGIAMAGAVTLTDAQLPSSPTNAPAGLATTNLPPVVPLRYTNIFAAAESRDFHAGGNWAGAPRGSNFLGGVRFEIDGLIQLTGRKAEENQRRFREFVSLSVPTNRYGSVHLLAATAWSSPENRRIADVVWRYTDGSFKRSPILYTGHVRDWWRRPFEQPRTVHSPLAKAAAIWTSPDSTRVGAALRMYRVTLANPEPAKPVALIQLQSAREDASLMVLATSLDPLAPGERPDPSPDLEPKDPDWTQHLGVTLIDATSSNVIGGATVQSVVLARHGPATLTVEQTATANGSGVADVLLPAEGVGSVALIASATGYAGSQLVLNPSGTNPLPAFITLKLHGGIELGGVILNSEGQPVPDAAVQVSRFWTSDRPALNLDPQHFTQAKAITGSDGRWSVSGIPASLTHRMGLSVRHPDYVHLHVHQLSADAATEKALREKSHEVRLKSAQRIRGIVLGPDRKPVPDATVRLGARYSAGIFEGTTDAQGRFQVGSQSPGKTVISARAKGFGPVVSEIVITADMPEVELSLNAATVFRGRVVDPDGNPLPDVWVSVDQAPTFDTRDLAAEVAEFSTRTDAEGRWSWDSGPDNPLKFSFSKEGFSEKSRVQIQPGPEEVTVTLDPPRVVEGIVLDTDSGDPVPRFRLAPRGGSWQEEDARDFDSADGRFSISLDKDHYETFEVTSPTHEPSTERIPASDNGRVQMTIRLKESEEFAGTVVDPTGRPVPRATIVLLTPRQPVILVGTRLQTISENAVQVAAGDGSFKLNPVRDPQGIVAAHDAGFARVSVEEFRASGRIVLLPWGRVEGTYHGRVDASGFTRLNVLLFAGASGISSQGPETSPQVAQGGSFTIENLPPGRHQLHRSISTGPISARSSFLEDFEVRSGETTTLDIQTKGVRVTGSLQLPAGVDFSRHRMNGQIRSPSPIPQGLSAEARQKLLQDPAVQQALSPRYYVEVRPDGSVSAEDVLPGQYEIWVFVVLMQGTQVADNWLVRQEFVVPEGATSPTQLGNLVPIQQPLKPINSQYVPLPRGP